MRSVFEILTLPFIRAGHGYDVGRESSGSDGDVGDGISTLWIVGGAVLALVAIVAILVSLNPSSARRRLKSVGGRALIVILITAPLVAWTASSLVGADEKSLVVERWTNDAGGAELILSLEDEELNTLETTNGKNVVSLECVDEEGVVLLAATAKWPFVVDPGYEYPHAHQTATREQLQRADSCSLRGTRVPLEADVKGVLTR